MSFYVSVELKQWRGIIFIAALQQYSFDFELHLMR